jgi:hypothetical protein
MALYPLRHDFGRMRQRGEIADYITLVSPKHCSRIRDRISAGCHGHANKTKLSQRAGGEICRTAPFCPRDESGAIRVSRQERCKHGIEVKEVLHGKSARMRLTSCKPSLGALGGITA